MGQNDEISSSPATRANFNTTHWSIVLAAGETSADESRFALEELCRTYWFPIYAYLRRKSYQPHDAQDLTQSFIASLLARGSLKDVARDKGRFRTFLLAALNHFLSDERDRAAAQKRGGGATLISLDEQTAENRYAAQLREWDTPDQLYDYHWALSLLDRAFARLKVEQENARTFERLQQFLVEKPPDLAYDTVARDLGTTNGAVRVAVSRLRRRYRDLVTEEVQNIVADSDEVPTELHLLLGHFSRP